MIEEERKKFEEGQVLLFDKPLYWTSFDLVNKVRGMIRSYLEIKKIKVGHAGTLDPLASGLMIICTGKFTKKIDEFSNLDKEYISTFHLGETTPSFDLETETDRKYPTEHITLEMVKRVLNGFLGEQQQVPPLYSAKFIDGKRAYEYARKGVEMKLEPVKVFFSEIELIDFSLPDVKVRMRCSKGTYIRSVARDLGEALGSGAYLSSLQRSSIGQYDIKGAWEVEKFRLFLQQMQQS
jgi:tRNA pseudouridine55 synthase